MTQDWTITTMDGTPTMMGTSEVDLIEVPQDRLLFIGIKAKDNERVDLNTGGLVEREPSLEEQRDRMALSVRQLYTGMYARGWATEAECLASGLPSLVLDAIDTLPENERVPAKIAWAKMASIGRMDPLMLLLGEQVNAGDEDLDEFFTSFAGA